jgi:hypothetical protein
MVLDRLEKVKILDSLDRHPPDWVGYFPGHPNTNARAPDIMAYLQTHYQRNDLLHWAQGDVWLLKRNE